jgi:hypothetical protein
MGSFQSFGKASNVKSAPGRRRRRPKKCRERFDTNVEPLKAGWGPAANAPEPDPPENLTIYEAIVWTFGEANGLRVPVIRVRIEAINAWWIGQGEPGKSAGGGAGWFAFISVPINQ